jgi:transketolase
MSHDRSTSVAIPTERELSSRPDASTVSPALSRRPSSLAPAVQHAQQIRVTILRTSRRANVGHIGSCLSVADILAVLLAEGLVGGESTDVERNRFVLSKGHAALALYAALTLVGRLDQTSLDAFCGDGSMLGTHPEHRVPGVDFATGSLGHGLSLGAGAALAARIQRSHRRTVVLLSDAELNEGSTWEAVMFAAHHRLTNLTAIIDLNGQQALGATREILDPGWESDRWRAFGWDSVEVAGHDHVALTHALATSGARPRVIVAHTTFGKGVSFMERQLAWHYLPMTDDQFREALAEVEAS